jgi:hypothetical protein
MPRCRDFANIMLLEALTQIASAAGIKQTINLGS